MADLKECPAVEMIMMLDVTTDESVGAVKLLSVDELIAQSSPDDERTPKVDAKQHVVHAISTTDSSHDDFTNVDSTRRHRLVVPQVCRLQWCTITCNSCRPVCHHQTDWRSPLQWRRHGYSTPISAGILSFSGLIFLVDRYKEMVTVYMNQVTPAELQALLCLHANMSEACVAPATDPDTGKTPGAFVAPKELISFRMKYSTSWMVKLSSADKSTVASPSWSLCLKWPVKWAVNLSKSMPAKWNTWDHTTVLVLLILTKRKEIKLLRPRTWLLKSE